MTPAPRPWPLNRFRFTLWPTVFTVPALIVLVVLGNWQVQRLAWKTDLIARRAAALAVAPRPAPEAAEAAQASDFHRVTADGVFLHDRELHLAAADRAGNPGYQIVTPLRLADGKILLVNRGYVPNERLDPATRQAGQIAGPAHIEGILRLPAQRHGWFVPVNRPADNFWFYVDLPAMGAAAHLPGPRVLPYTVDAGPAPNPGGWPLGGQTVTDLPNDHLQYAITWYGFALTLTIIYFVYHYRKPERPPP